MAKKSRAWPLRDGNWIEFQQHFERSDDRSCAILFAAYLDNALHTALLSNAKHPNKCLDRLLGETRPLGTFSAKIDLFHSLGWLSEEVCNDLHQIRRIRNLFAHEVDNLAFNSSDIANKCAALLASKITFIFRNVCIAARSATHCVYYRRQSVRWRNSSIHEAIEKARK